MGGKSKSSSSQSTSTTNRQVNAAVEDISNSNVITNSGDNVTVTTTDHGAINAAADIATESLETAADIAYESLELTGETASQAIEANRWAFGQTTAAVERIAANSQTNGQAVVADSLVKVFRPFALALLALGALSLLVIIIKQRGKG